MIRVFLADDHNLVRAGIRHILDAEPDIMVVGEAEDGRRTLRALSDLDAEIDVLVLDIAMPYLNGMETLRRLQDTRPAIKTLIVSMYPEAQFAQRLTEAGASGYLSKHRSEDEIVAAVRALASGQSYHPPPTATSSATSTMSLTAREHQVFTLVVSGSTVSEIAAELNLAVSTVSTHLRQVKDKLGAESIADILGYAHRMGLIG